MRLFLIRHGETVDNVAGLYAGVRDSALTVQGNLQAERLGKFFAAQNVLFTHVFSSTFQRAFKTANALLALQPPLASGNDAGKISNVRLEVLREQDFGFYEGKPFYARPKGSDKSGKEEHREQHKNDPDFKDVESKDSMATRADEFLNDYLMPILITEEQPGDAIVAVVSHGIMLSALWRSFLRRFSPGSVSLGPGLQIGGGVVTPLENLGGWSNTGYLELDVKEAGGNDGPSTDDGILELNKDIQRPEDADENVLSRCRMTIRTVNSKEHLMGLKRTRGVGSSQFDEGQQKIESFFKKPRV